MKKIAFILVIVLALTSIGFRFTVKKNNQQKGYTMETATFGAGCFWGVEYTFSQLNGVKHTAVGYMGGDLNNPTYEQVCSDKTGHAEVVQVQYNPLEISYKTLLQIFWENHDPTTINRQGPDVGKQYRSVIFFHTEEQRNEALVSKSELEKSGKFTRTVVTQIVPAVTFWPAEDYHQKYYEKRGMKGCNIH